MTLSTELREASRGEEVGPAARLLPGAAAGLPFHELLRCVELEHERALQRVQAAHERQIDELRAANAALRGRLLEYEVLGSALMPAAGTKRAEASSVRSEPATLGQLPGEPIQPFESHASIPEGAPQPLRRHGEDWPTLPADRASERCRGPVPGPVARATVSPSSSRFLPQFEASLTGKAIQRASAAEIQEEESEHGIMRQSSTSSCFALRGSWHSPDEFTPSSTKKRFQLARGDPLSSVKDLNSFGSPGSKETESVVEAVAGSYVRKFISHPSSPYRLAWDLCGTAFIGWDIIMIPMSVFELPDNWFLTMMGWMTLLFWTSDIVASFLVGYVDHGVTVTCPKKVAVHYLQTWLIPDIVVVVADWITTTTTTGKTATDDSSDVGRLFRVLRVLRTIRLLRLLKLKRVVDKIHDRIDSEYLSILGNILKLILMLLVASHFIGCIWYAIGSFGEQRSWIGIQGFEAEGVGYLYTTSLHWSLTQFTPASMTVQPQNVMERTYAILVLVVALVGFSSLMGSITASMTQLRNMSKDTSKQFWMLRKYLREHRVNRMLAARVYRYLEYACERQQRIMDESKVPLLSLLTEELRVEVKCAVTVPHLMAHPLFAYISRSSELTMHRIFSSGAVSQKSLASGDSLFFAGDVAVHMYFVSSGELSYLKASSCVPLRVSEWASEPVLWTMWEHVGELKAQSESMLVAVRARIFAEAMRACPLIYESIYYYAKCYIDWLNEDLHAALTDVASDNREQHCFSQCFEHCSPAVAHEQALRHPRNSMPLVDIVRQSLLSDARRFSGIFRRRPTQTTFASSRNASSANSAFAADGSVSASLTDRPSECSEGPVRRVATVESVG